MRKSSVLQSATAMQTRLKCMSIVSKPRRYRPTNGVDVGCTGLPLRRQLAHETSNRLRRT